MDSIPACDCRNTGIWYQGPVCGRFPELSGATWTCSRSDSLDRAHIGLPLPRWTSLGLIVRNIKCLSRLDLIVSMFTSFLLKESVSVWPLPGRRNYFVGPFQWWCSNCFGKFLCWNILLYLKCFKLFQNIEIWFSAIFVPLEMIDLSPPAVPKLLVSPRLMEIHRFVRKEKWKLQKAILWKSQKMLFCNFFAF